MTKPEGEARMDCRDAVGLVERLRSWGYAPGRATALEAADMIEALSAPVPTGEGGAVAWGCFENGQLDERLVYRDERRAGDAAFAFTPSLDVRPLYAHPRPAQGEGVEALRFYDVKAAISRAMQVTRDGAPGGCVVEAGCKALDYDDPSYVASGFIWDAAEAAILAALTTGKGGER